MEATLIQNVKNFIKAGASLTGSGVTSFDTRVPQLVSREMAPVPTWWLVPEENVEFGHIQERGGGQESMPGGLPLLCPKRWRYIQQKCPWTRVTCLREGSSWGSSVERWKANRLSRLQAWKYRRKDWRK